MCLECLLLVGFANWEMGDERGGKRQRRARTLFWLGILGDFKRFVEIGCHDGQSQGRA